VPLETGQILNNRYRIVKRLNQGGFGTIYRAWDLNLKGPCALKESAMTTDASYEQFAREAALLHSLRHSNLPRVIDHFVVPGQGHYLVMEYIEGEDLQEKLEKAGGALPEAQVLAWIDQVCNALIYLHHRKPPIIHRDLKPANIRITPEGEAILVDFGIAKRYEPNLRTALGARAATDGYAPFEQYGQQPTDVRSDVYALGATVYALLTGQVPPVSIDRLRGQPLQPPRSLNAAISPGVEAAILRAMELMPEGRCQSMEEFKIALLRGPQGQTPPTASRPATVQASSPFIVKANSDSSALPSVAGQVAAPAQVPRAQSRASIPPAANSHVPVAPPRATAHAAVPVARPLWPGIPRNRPPGLHLPILKRRPGLTLGLGLGGLAALAILCVVLIFALRTVVSSPVPGVMGVETAQGVLFTSDREGRAAIYRLKGNGDVDAVTSPDDLGESWSAVAGVGGRILFTSNRGAGSGGGKREIYRLTPEGNVEQVTTTAGNAESWSPAPALDGSILFVSNRGTGKREIYRLTPEGKVEQVTNTAGEAESWSPAPALDGSILFVSNRGVGAGIGKREIYRLTAEGKVDQVTNTVGSAESWSPMPAVDGSILFVSNRGTAKREIYRLTRDGKVEQVTNTAGSAQSWSPAVGLDGSLLFVSNRSGKREIYRLTQEGQIEQVTLTAGSGESWLLDED
jgi:serine/threonine protein kinase/6-phosphogluconolactonase (cycloisomerase 2 family)